MNKQQLEKMFNEQFGILSDVTDKYGFFNARIKIEDFIFNTVIPEVLKSMKFTDNDIDKIMNEFFDNDWEDATFDNIKLEQITNRTMQQRAKELYNITL